MKFAIINKRKLYIRNHIDMEDARTWAQNHLDCSYEILIRAIDEEPQEILESRINDSTRNN